MMSRIRLPLAVLGAAVLTLMIAACGGNDEDQTGEPATAGADEELTIGAAYAGLNQPFFAGFRNGAREAAQELNVELIEIDGESDTNTQANGVQDLIAQQPDGVLITPNDATVGQSMVDDMVESDIPVVAAAQQIGDPDARDIEDVYPDLVALVTQDEAGAGRTAGEIALDVLPENQAVQVAIVEGQPGYAEVQQRTDGFTAALDEAGIDYEIVASQPGDWVRDRGQAVCENIAASNPDVDLYFAHNDEMGVGCSNALSAAGFDADIIGIGGSEGGIEAIESGDLVGTVCYKPAEMARIGLTTLVEYLRGEREETAEFITYETPGITSENVEDCDPEW